MSPIWQMCDGGYATTPAYLLSGSLWTLPVQDQLLSLSWCSVHFAPALFLSSPALETMDVPISLQFPGNSIFPSRPQPPFLSLSLLPSLTISTNLSLSLHATPPPCMLPHSCSYCALLLTYALLPPSLPVLLSPSAVSSGPYLSHFPAFFLVAQGEQPLLSAPESSRWWFGRIMHLGRVDSRLLITPFCTLLQYFNVLRLVTKSIWLTTEPVVTLSSELMP